MSSEKGLRLINVLTEPIFSVSDQSRLFSLSELLAEMSQGNVAEFPSLRPHQRPAWHMFLVQLGSLAMWKSGQVHLPMEAEFWLFSLRELTSEHPDDSPWCMVVEDWTQPAFLQPPAPSDLKWNQIATPDALDILISARNHDIKQEVIREARTEDWIYALMSIQTSAGYDGPKNYGIARMNGGSSSRSLLGLSPLRGNHLSLDESDWWKRDVERLVAHRRQGKDPSFGRVGGESLLWCVEWSEGKQLSLQQLDPWFVEVSRRIRVSIRNDHVLVQHANSKQSRIDAKEFKGHVGDPWAPINKEKGTSLTLGDGSFGYKRIHQLLFEGTWQRPFLASLGDEEKEADYALVAEALSRGNCKTFGFKSRVIPMPKHLASFFDSDTMGSLSQQQIDEIRGFDTALRKAIALFAAQGDPKRVNKSHNLASKPFRDRFDRRADELFFAHLWERLELVTSGDTEGAKDAKEIFLKKLLKAAERELNLALQTVNCSTVYRHRADTRSRGYFRWLATSMLQDQRPTDADEGQENE